MMLKKISYSQNHNEDSSWAFRDFVFGQTNLIVGKNASGKTKTLTLLGSLAKVLSGRVRPGLWTANFDVLFWDDGVEYSYRLKLEKGNIVEEVLASPTTGKTFLERDKKGVGKILAEKIDGGKMMDFQSPTNAVAILNKRDLLQHPFLEKFYSWGMSTYSYAFGTSMGKDQLAILPKEENANPSDNVAVVGDIHEHKQAIANFYSAYKKFGSKFVKRVIADMGELGYELESIDLRTPKSIKLSAPVPGEPVGIFVKEKRLKCHTEQVEISQGMFRALSIFIHVNYALLSGRPSCFIIDDIGEGLDFERSCSIVKLLRARTLKSKVQLIMSTNDRFIMNSVPLKEWTILGFASGGISITNYGNSKNKFDDFEYAGLNNFDFFSAEAC